MNLTGLHLLLTLQCTRECDHCFVWGSPRQDDTMTLETVREILRQAGETGGIEWIYIEGGEPFLYHPLLATGVREAHENGFRVGIVTNAYWAVTPEDAKIWLEPLAGRVGMLSVSSDTYHEEGGPVGRAGNLIAAAGDLGIETDVLSLAPVGEASKPEEGIFSVLFKGRAAEVLAAGAPRHPGLGFTECPIENLREPGRVHVDASGNLHVCQGISIGNLFRRHLKEICADYDPDTHPVIGPLLAGGPAELARRGNVPLEEQGYADACHLCFTTRRVLLDRFPEILTPASVYGPPGEG